MCHVGADEAWCSAEAVQGEPLFLLQTGIHPVLLGQMRFKIANTVN